MSQRIILLQIICISALLGNIAAWHANGHYIVAYIAQSYLIRNNPEALDWANKLLEPYTQLCGENLYPFVESATWADKIRDADFNVMFHHHFVSLAWFDEGAKAYQFDNNSFANVVFAIDSHVSQLESKKEDPYGSSKSILGKSFAMRNLIHYLGDIHQPLHASERVTPKRPNGDEGGNFFVIDHYGKESIDNLHFIWDHMFEPLNSDIRTQLNPDQYQYIKAKGESIIDQYPIDTVEDLLTEHATSDSWAKESNQIAREFVYANIQEGQDLPEDYQIKGFEICRKRVALGGYRLGKLISDIHKKLTAPVIIEETESLKKITS